MNFTITNARIPNAFIDSSLVTFVPGEHTTFADVDIKNGVIDAVRLANDSETPQSINLNGNLLFPAFLDSHTHLDKAHSWNRAPNISGTFAEALTVLGNDKDNWTTEDVYNRAHFAVQSAYAYGTAAIRTHVDTGLPWAERSYKALAQLKADWKGKVDIQMVSLCGVADYAQSHGKDIADLPIKYGASALGGMPLMNPNLPHELDCMMALATERKIGLDLHVDESMDPNATCLEEIAKAVLRNHFEFPVTCGHCCSLATFPYEKQKQTLELVKAAGIHIISLPLCNLYLQDRRTTEAIQTPYFRGITLIKEFQAQGSQVACASDNIRDAFYAYGDLDMLEVLTQSLRIAHLDDNFSNALKTSHQAPATIMGLPSRGSILKGMDAKLVSFDCRTLSELFSRPRIDRKILEDGEFKSIAPPRYEDLVL